MLILAGSYWEARTYALREKVGSWRYLDEPRRLQGIRGKVVYCVGSWKERIDVDQFRTMAQVNELRLVEAL